MTQYGEPAELCDLGPLQPNHQSAFTATKQVPGKIAMSKTVLAMTSLRPNADEALKTYLAVVTPLMEKAGARLLSRHSVAENLSASEPPQFVSMVEYPDADAIRLVFEDPEYLALRRVRDAAFSRYDICVLESAED